MAGTRLLGLETGGGYDATAARAAYAATALGPAGVADPMAARHRRGAGTPSRSMMNRRMSSFRATATFAVACPRRGCRVL
jgi:hypothetical protein